MSCTNRLPSIASYASYGKLSHWHERTQKNPEVIHEADAIYELNNIAEGSLIVIDEAWKLWPAAGRAKVSEDIEYLRMDRHHGLDFLLVAQAPNLIHAEVLCLVEKHLHITPTWAGRKIFEWPEYCSTPRLKTSKENAVKRPYKLPKKSFELYKSASIHTKPSKTIPLKLWTSIAAIVLAPLLVYFSFDRIMSRLDPQEPTTTIEAKAEIEKPQVIPVNQPGKPAPVLLPVAPTTPTLVSDQVDWSRVLTCISSKTQCICYGHSTERLVIPVETCRLAAKHGFPRKSQPAIATHL
ncbi:zonular occludens toxin domain-containing protein [Nitrosomonas sp. Is37]|uniref:zonular occludens toxin domain-containing protein n=1 Tax=Nitrosomonas sp. Is37 TaxID=3080535 RepID=UPI00294ADDED|nr:zonular occludens toxin domain-containing protein [Nitrosomonas sp. Is37]MDV6345555.1 zonular occludens toxin domain-containing protein [Nitrosomonas sp. Is37]